ncbi:DUF6482 family protein [Phytohalomonas tamaricis]|uniref:DUF6482 family protein n=1 Tax=Phytohalomonas tamaricis TaxID=2081032 RepID=UPI000D0B86FB|nr:DUF6482 family protein [Phytohalomonas tamaricis]
MNLQQLQQAASQKKDAEVRVIRHNDSQLYQVEYQQGEGERWLLKRCGKPQLFRSLDAVYDELRHIGIRQAFLVQRGGKDYVHGYDAHYHGAMTATVPLAF